MQKRGKVPVYCHQPLVSRDCVHALRSTVDAESGLTSVDVYLINSHNTIWDIDANDLKEFLVWVWSSATDD